MDIEFDPEKDEANIAKHGVSLARASDLLFETIEHDSRFAGEERFRGYGLLGDVPHCLAFTMRNGVVRAISLRRTHLKEYRRHVRT